MDVPADARLGPRSPLELVVPEVRLHVAEADDLGAQVAFGRAGAVDELVGREAREEDFWIRGARVGVALLWDEQVAELAEDELAWAGGGAVVGEVGEVGGLVGAVGTGAGGVEDVGVFGV